ncbi:MAG: DUF6599 family protein [Polyangiaceae bacterium]
MISRISPARSLLLALLSLSAVTGGCKEDPKPTPPPPGLGAGSSSAASSAAPSASASAKASACAGGGAEVKDAVSGAYFPRTVGGYCVDPNSEVRTYGEKAKYTMDEVCTTAFDGECEVYKRYQLKRVVSVHYVDAAGKGSVVEIILSQFADAAGAYGMFTKRVIADGDPAEPTTPRVLAAGGAGAIGTGRAYVWKGEHLVELQYNNEQESPAELAKSSAAALAEIGKAIGEKLPGKADLLPSAKALPTENLIPNGIQFAPKDSLGIANAGAGAVGYYKEGAKRFRVAAFVRDDAEQAKDVMKALKAKPGAASVSGIGDEGLSFGLTGKDAPRTEWVAARKNNVVFAIGDEEYSLKEPEKQAAARVGKEDAQKRLKALLSAPLPAASASGASSAAPSPSASTAPKK